MTVLADVLRDATSRFPERNAIVAADCTLTYAQLDAASASVAGALAGRRVEHGTVTALTLPAGIDYIVTYVALARLGAITAGINPRYTQAEQDKVIGALAPDVVIDQPVRDETHVPVTRDVPTTDDDVETIVFTSGTTGTPRGAIFTSRQVRAITEIDTGWRWGSGGPQLVATGLSHIGFMTKLAGNLVLGTTMHVLAKWTAGDALRIIAHERIAYLGGVAAQISLLMRHPDFERNDFSAVQGLIVGAGPSPLPLVKEARERFGAGYSIRYSSTESGGLGTLTAFEATDREYETVGRPRPEVELEIRDPESGDPVPTGTAGQICLRSDAVMAGYWRDPDATAAALDAHGWLRTGDLGRVRDDGCLQLSGRISEMYIRGGYNVFPLEVEAVLLDHPSIGSVAMVPRPDPVMGEIGVAVVVPRPGTSPPTLDDLRAFAAPRLAAYKLPEAMRVVDVIPLTSMDKIDRRTLAAREAAEHP